jgi:maltooligosyltrehalose trehalohydrolase
VQPAGGWGLDAVWADDFHHQVRVALTGEQDGYYADYAGTAADLAATLMQGWFYTGQHSKALDRARGAPAEDIGPPHFVYCIQNHDQVGNRALGDRLSHAIDLDAYRAVSALLLLSPYTPLIWMGQEWAATSPFLYFTDHNPELGRLVTEARRAEFAGFGAFGEQVPDPQDPATFARSKLHWAERDRPPHAGILRLYRDLLALRSRLPPLLTRRRDTFMAKSLGEHALAMRRAGSAAEHELLVVVSLRGALELRLGDRPELAPSAGYTWAPLLDTEGAEYDGRGDTHVSQFTTELGVNDLKIELSGPGAVVFGCM